MHALARLIEDVRAANHWNQAEVGRRIKMSRGRVNQLLGDVRRVPKRETVDQIARGLGVPAWVVMDAYLETVGLPTRPNRVSVEEAVSADAELSADDKHAVLAFVKLIRSRSRPVVELDRAEGLRLADPKPDRSVKNHGVS